MRITYALKGILEIDDVRLIHKNFAGRGNRYNKEGDRNFSIFIPTQEIADELIKDGWNVKIKAPANPDDNVFMYLPVKVKFNGRGPKIYLESNGKMMELFEEDAFKIDTMDIATASLDIRPYDWEMPNGETGRTAYLQAIKITQNVNRFEKEFEAPSEPDSIPFE